MTAKIVKLSVLISNAKEWGVPLHEGLDYMSQDAGQTLQVTEQECDCPEDCMTECDGWDDVVEVYPASYDEPGLDNIRFECQLCGRSQWSQDM